MEIDEIKRQWKENGSKWITSREGITNDVINWAKDFGNFLAKPKDSNNRDYLDKLSTSQLRKFFGKLRRIQAEGYEKNKNELYMLKAQLAYANGRERGNNKTKIRYFAEILSEAIDIVETEEHFKNFVNIVEAIVAFHKAAGGE
jgi:CRISPR type III-A-associated protein Csm2